MATSGGGRETEIQHSLEKGLISAISGSGSRAKPCSGRAKGHIQATGRDDRGRKQYRHHPDFSAVRDGNKYEHIVVFGAALARLRRQVNRDMSRRGLSRAKVIATVVYLLDTTLIRVGNASYARENGSFGLTTLRDHHVKIGGTAVRFEFKGKSGKTWRLQMQDRRVARIVKSCQDLPGQHLFQYTSQLHAASSSQRRKKRRSGA